MLFDVGMPIINQAMAVCPVTGYVLQYRMIHRHESVGAFSIDICLVLLVANILRLNYYPFTPFGTALVFQSLFMIAAQLILLHACARYKSEALSTVTNDSEEDESFWRWSSFTPFCTFYEMQGKRRLCLLLVRPH